MHTQHTASSSLLQHWQALVAPSVSICQQQRSWQRLMVLSCGMLSALGRHTLSQVIVTIGSGDEEWSAWYRMFNCPRADWDAAQQLLLAAVLEEVPAGAPLTVAVDATHLPRTSSRMPGVGWAPQPRTPAWMRGIHLAQRWAGLSVLLPRSSDGESRALPLRFIPACPPRARQIEDHPPMTEWEAGLAHLEWLRQSLDALGEEERTILAVGDAAYAAAPLRRQLPARTMLLSRCHRNRALYALPRSQPGRGRKRWYGPRLPTPHDYRVEGRHFRRLTIIVRGRNVTLQVRVEGPVLIRPAADHPLFLLVVKGYTPPQQGSQRRREPTYLLIDAEPTAHGDGWQLPLPLSELLTVAWQRWEVEVMHRELKSGFGLGQQQQWSSLGVVSVVQWIVWLYATILLAGYRAWGYRPPGPHGLGCWWTPRRWSLATLWQRMRRDIWRFAEFRPVWTRAPDRWGEIEAWFASPDNLLGGYRRF